MAELSDVELLSSLRVVLTPAPARPDAKALAQLHATLEELAIEFEPVDITTAAQHRVPGRRPDRRRPRRTATRSSIVAVGAFAFALTAGVAVAAVATDTLPGPTRAFAYDVGLPVTSPALFKAQQSLERLRQAILAKNVPQEKRLGQELISDLQSLDYSDLTQIRATADTLLVEVGLTLPTLSNASNSPTTPAISIPSVSVPSVSIPGVNVPGISVPRVTVPSVNVPSVSVPSVTTPAVTTPTVTIPSVSGPQVTTSSIPLPVVTIPIVTLPGLSIPVLGNLGL
jgi:hypothetical protein